MKKALLVMALASSLLLASCGTKPVSSSASDSGTSSSESVSSSSSSSSGSSTLPVDPEAAYKVSEAEFIDALMNKLSNVTIDISNSNHNNHYTKIVYSGMQGLAVSDGSSSGGEYSYSEVDAAGVFRQIDVLHSNGQLENVYEPYETGLLNAKSYYEVVRTNFFFTNLGFDSLKDLSGKISTAAVDIYFDEKILKPYLQGYYASLTYDSSTHSYKGKESQIYFGETQVTSLSFHNQYLVESQLLEMYAGGSEETTTYAYSQYGSSVITGLSTENANYLDYFTVRFYDEDKTTLLNQKYVAYGQSVSYSGSYRHALTEDTGSYTISGWSLMGKSNQLDDTFFQTTYGNHDLVAIWEKVDNADLYEFDHSTGILTFNGKAGIGSLKVPSSVDDVDVVALNLDKLTLDLTEVYLPATVSEVTKVSTTDDNVFLSNVEFSVDSTSTKLQVKDGALLNKKGMVLYSYYGRGTETKYVADKFLSTIADFAFAYTNLEEVDLSESSIPSLGEGVFFGCEKIKKFSFPTKLQNIGANCFSGCMFLASVNLKSTAVTTIGESAFGDDENLKEVTLPNTLVSIGAKAFQNTLISYIYLPSNLKTLGGSAFLHCLFLTKVDTGTSIDAPDLLKNGSDFMGCTSLETFLIPDCVTTIGESSFDSDTHYAFNLPSKLTTIGAGAFSNTLGPSTLTLPSTVTSLGSGAFAHVQALTSADLSKTTLTELTSYAFRNCTNLTSITLPSTLLKLDPFCLANTGLKTFTIAENMLFDTGAFSACQDLTLTNLNTSQYALDTTGHFVYDTGLTDLIASVGSPTSYKAPATLTKTDDHALSYLSSLTKADFSAVTSALTFGYGAFLDDTALTDVTFPSGQVTLKTDDFKNTGFTSVTLPSNVDISNASNLYYECAKLESVDLSATTSKILQGEAFASCPLLSSVKLSSSLTSIYSAAFADDTSLKSLVIPSSVVHIRSHAFASCSEDLKLYLEAVVVPPAFESDWNTLDNNVKAEYLLYSNTEPDYTSAGTQRYWHYDANKNPVIWVQA